MKIFYLIKAIKPFSYISINFIYKISYFFDKMTILHFMLHNKLRKLRKQKGVTQEDMANALHKSQNAYSLALLNKEKAS